MLLALSATVAALEKPEYEIIAETDEYEIRRYAPYIVAETVVEGSFDEAGDDAFRILAGYIFGGNQAGAKMRMTAPVESRPSDEGVQMNMTAPVLSSEDDAKRFTYGFVMEKKYSLDTLPEPNDSRVSFRQVSSRYVAARRYSGRWTEKNYDSNKQALVEALKEDGVVAIGAPLLARYNPPIMPWFMRRNEILLEVAWSD